MRKREKQQKNHRTYQMTLFDNYGAPHHDDGSGTTGHQGGGVDYLSQLE